MSTLVKTTPQQIDQLLSAVRSAASVDDLTEIRARIVAARAWAKVHRQVQEIRLDLLRVEVEALVQIVNLGAAGDLNGNDRPVAEYLASLSQSERDTLIADTGAAITTATGMVRALWRAEGAERERLTRVTHGRDIAERPTQYDREAMRRYVEETAYRVEDVLNGVLDDHARDGVPFTVAELADKVIWRAGIGDAQSDAAVLDGVREVCRKAIRRAPVVMIEGTVLPRFVTAHTEDGHHIRIPVENAQLGHLAVMIEGRREQLNQDAARLKDLEVAYARLADLAHDDTARIGDIMLADLATNKGEPNG